MINSRRRDDVWAEVVRLVGGEMTSHPATSIAGSYAGVPIEFSFSNPDDLDVHARIAATFPSPALLFLDLRPGVADDVIVRRAPFFSSLVGEAAPLDIASRLLNKNVCDMLSRIPNFVLETHGGRERTFALEVSLYVRGGIDDVVVARDAIEVIATIVRSLPDAVAAADTNDLATTTGAYRGDPTTLARVEHRRVAEIASARARSLARYSTLRRKIAELTGVAGIALFFVALTGACIVGVVMWILRIAAQ